MTRIFFMSNAATAAMVALFCLFGGTLWLLLICILLLVPYLLAMLWWAIQVDHADQRILPREDAPQFPQPLQFIGAHDKSSGEQQ